MRSTCCSAGGPRGAEKGTHKWGLSQFFLSLSRRGKWGLSLFLFILIELRLTAVATGQELLLLRNRKHGQTVADAALNYADDLVKFLR